MLMHKINFEARFPDSATACQNMPRRDSSGEFTPESETIGWVLGQYLLLHVL